VPLNQPWSARRGPWKRNAFFGHWSAAWRATLQYLALPCPPDEQSLPGEFCCSSSDVLAERSRKGPGRSERTAHIKNRPGPGWHSAPHCLDGHQPCKRHPNRRALNFQASPTSQNKKSQPARAVCQPELGAWVISSCACRASPFPLSIQFQSAQGWCSHTRVWFTPFSQNLAGIETGDGSRCWRGARHRGSGNGRHVGAACTALAAA
jgi:hypothetical protein